MVYSREFIKERSRQLSMMMALVQLGIFSPSLAADTNGAGASTVHIGSQTVISLPQMPGLSSASAKAKEIQKNIDNSLVASTNRTPSTIKVTYVKGEPVITLGGFLVTKVDTATARAAHTTPAILTQRWVNALKAALVNKANLNSYLAQLTGTSPAVGTSRSKAASSQKLAQSSPNSQSFENANNSNSRQNSSGENFDNGGRQNSQRPYAKARVVFVPAGMVMPLKLSTALSSQVSKPGDMVVATLTEPVNLGDATIPANTVISGHVTKSSTGTYLSKSGRLGIKFTSMRTPDGVETPITAHILGNVGKFQAVEEGSDVFRGETGETKVKKALVGAAVGAGSGVFLGTTIGAIAGGGRGAGRGALAGTALGAGMGALLSYLDKGKDVSVSSEETVKLQLDSPAKFALASFAAVQN